jgi:hypothetical protein
MASRLSKLTSLYGEWVTDADHKIDVYHVRSPHLLIQAAGYLKHVTGKEGLYGIHFRGQATLYGNSMKPTLSLGDFEIICAVNLLPPLAAGG